MNAVSSTEDFADGSRRYWVDRQGTTSGFQRMAKIVDADEITLQIVQEFMMTKALQSNDIRSIR